MSIVVSWGRWGGFYANFGYMWRVCLGFVALTIIPREIDDILAENAADGGGEGVEK